ncbi:hypothetical protein H5410_046032 [Solanum commersonii]|uniref:DUF4283 domain-containing protein n=1 Tax=Solanum commersonii TaxID=4109 RepID=A0A9J5XEH1_SOLCO|nr:hypothetical protein H5410_046032 [Solanum commersonii]
MAQKSKTEGGGQTTQLNKPIHVANSKGRTQPGDSKKMRSMNVLQSIQPLDLTEVAPLVPSTPVIQSAGTSSWADQVEGEVSQSNKLGKFRTLESSWSEIVGNPKMCANLQREEEVMQSNNMKITLDDIKEEVAYRNSTVVCYVLGVNPSLMVKEGAFKRIWGALGIDKISQTNRGIFLIRFHTIQSRDKVIEGGIQLFDRKHVIVKPWKEGLDMKKIIVYKVPTWIRLPNLDLKYWGNATATRQRLMFARVLVEVTLNQPLPNTIMFENEIGCIVEQNVEYEWKPILYTHCKNYSHEIQNCRKVANEKGKEEERKGKQQDLAGQ